MDFISGFIIALLVLAVIIAVLLAAYFYRRWRQSVRQFAFSEQSRASRIKLETTRQITKQHQRLIARYVRYLDNPIRDIEKLAREISSSDSLVDSHVCAAQLVTRSHLLSQSVETLRDYAALERGELPLNLRAMSSHALMEEAVAIMRAICAPRHQHLQLDIQAWQDEKILADKAKFCTMMGHLAHGAACYLPEESVLTLTAESMHASSKRMTAWISLSDTNILHDLPNDDEVFDPLLSPLKFPDGTTGDGQFPHLDLPFAHRLAGLMGGTLRFHSSTTGCRTEVEMFFTIAED